MSSSQAFFTVNQVSERYSISPATVRNWLALGLISEIRQGHVLRFSMDSLEQFERLSQYPADRRGG